LLVFDNCEDIDDLSPYFPRSIQSRSSIIITTQKSGFFPITDPTDTVSLNVANLERNHGGEIVFNYLQRKPQDEDELEDARKISDLVDGLPLALATIGGYMNQVGTSVSTYYHNLKTSSKAWEASAIGPAKQYEKKLETVFDMAFKELPEKARNVLNMLAFLNPDRIPEEMFYRNMGKPTLDFLSSEAE
jgi:hypothetical protein